MSPNGDPPGQRSDAMTSTQPPLDETRTAARISAIVGSWPDVEVGAHRFGGVEFRLGRRELGHLHATATRTSPSRARFATSWSRPGVLFARAASRFPQNATGWKQQHAVE